MINQDYRVRKRLLSAESFLLARFLNYIFYAGPSHLLTTTPISCSANGRTPHSTNKSTLPLRLQTMHPDRATIAQIILETLHELGEDLNNAQLQAADESTRLFGARSVLDSMNLVNFIAEVEDRLSDDFDIQIILANQSAMSRTHSPFRRVSSCVDYIMELMAENES